MPYIWNTLLLDLLWATNLFMSRETIKTRRTMKTAAQTTNILFISLIASSASIASSIADLSVAFVLYSNAYSDLNPYRLALTFIIST